MHKLVFSNADATPKNVCVVLSRESIPHVMAWYGAYFAGDRYTVTLDGRNVPMDQNGEMRTMVGCVFEDDAQVVHSPANAGFAEHDNHAKIGEWGELVDWGNQDCDKFEI